MEAAAPPPVDALALALLAIRGDPADVHTVTIAEGRIAAHEGEPPGHAADELAAVGLRHLNELVFNNGGDLRRASVLSFCLVILLWWHPQCGTSWRRTTGASFPL